MANIKVNIDVDSGKVSIASDKVLTLQQQIKILRQELQKIPEGTKEFNLLAAKLNDTRDAFDRVNIKGKEIFGTLGLIPGPIGEIAARTNSAIDALKIFGSFSANDIKAQFIALGNDIKEAGKAFLDLTGITRLYTITARALSTALQGVGISAATATVAARALSAALIGTGILAFVALLGMATSALMNLFDSEARVKDAVDKTKESIDKQNKAIEENTKVANVNNNLKLAQLKKAGADEDAIRAQQIKNAKAALDTARINEQNARDKFFKAQAKIEEERIKSDLENAFGIDRSVRVQQAKKQADLFAADLKAKKIASLEAETALTNIEGDGVQDRIKLNETASTTAQKKREQDLENIKKNAEAAQMAVLEGRKKELAGVDKTYSDQIALAKKYGKDTTALEEARRVERKRINAKYDEDEAKNAAEFAKKLADITIASIINDLQQQKAARQEKYSEDLRNLEKDKEFIKLSEEAKNVYRQQLRQAADQDIVELEDKASQEVFDRKLKALQLESEGLIRGTKSYYDNRKATINELEKSELNDLRIKLNQELITTEEFEKQKANILAKYTQQRKDLAKLELNDYLTFATQILGAVNGVLGMASNNLRMQQENDIASAEGNEEKIEAIKRKGFEDNKKIQIAQAIIGTLQSAVQAFQSLSVIPIVGPALGAAAAAAALIFGYKQVALIKAQQYKSSSSSSSASSGAVGSSASSPAFSTPTIGAPQIGATSAQTGTIAGIAAGTIAANQSTDRPIKAYVVGNDVTTEQQLQRRLRTMARLGG